MGHQPSGHVGTVGQLFEWVDVQRSLSLGRDGDGTVWTSKATWVEGGHWGEWFEHTLHGTGDDNLWAVDLDYPRHWNGTALTPTTGGTYPLKDGPMGLWGTTSDLWSPGKNGSLSHWDGHSWCRHDLVEKTNFIAISGSGPLDIWAIGDMGAIYHYGPK